MEKEKKKLILYVDLDGTCFEFKKHKSLEPLFEKGYFKKIPPFMNMIEAISEFAKKHPEVTIKTLSHYITEGQYILADKNTAIDKYMSFIPKENRIFIPYGESKAQYASQGSVIIDDYTPNLLDFEEKGGKGIKFINDINWNTKSWAGEIIHYEYPAWMIVSCLEKIITKEDHS